MKKVRKRRIKKGRVYQELALEIFGDEEAFNCWQMDIPVSDKRIEIIDSAIPPSVLQNMSRVAALKKRAFAHLKAAVDPINHKPPVEVEREKVAPQPLSVDRPSPLDEFSVIEVAPLSKEENIFMHINRYDAVVYEEGRLEGMYVQLLKAAAAQHLKGLGKRPANVVFVEHVITRMLEERIKRNPSERTWNALKVANAIGVTLVDELKAVVARRWPADAQEEEEEKEEDRPDWADDILRDEWKDIKIRRYVERIRKRHKQLREIG